jgi:hypothetical protein
MCHPGLAQPELDVTDAIAATRPQEYAFLIGDAFPALLERNGARVVRFGEFPTS